MRGLSATVARRKELIASGLVAVFSPTFRKFLPLGVFDEDLR